MGSRAVIGRRIREARLRLGLSRKQLGIKAGIDEGGSDDFLRRKLVDLAVAESQE
jgi:transcriptional regulator with XRE-family HTH domain